MIFQRYVFAKQKKVKFSAIIHKTWFLPPAYVVRGKVIFILGNVCLFTWGGGGGPMSQIFFLGGGGPRSQIFRGGSHVSDFWGGPMPQIFGGGGPRSQICGGGGTQSQ